MQTRVETAEQFLGAQEGAVTQGDFLTTSDAQAPLPRPYGRILVAAGLVAVLVLSLGAYALWQSRPTEPAPRLSQDRMTGFAFAEGLICQPPQAGPVAEYWHCAGTSPRLVLDWYLPPSGRVVSIEAAAGPRVEAARATDYFGRVLRLTMPSDQLGSAQSWVRGNLTQGQTTLGPVSLATSAQGAPVAYTLDVELT